MKIKDYIDRELTKEDKKNIIFSNVNDTLEKADYTVVFGSFDFIEERIQKAISIYKEGRTKYLILTGGTITDANTYGYKVSEAYMMKKIALENGIPEEAIYVEDQSSNTIENVKNIKKLLDSFGGISKLLLVSSKFHIKRCMYLMRAYYKDNIKYILAASTNILSDETNWDKYPKGNFLIDKEIEKIFIEVKKGTFPNFDV